MPTEVIASLISGLCVAIPTIIATVSSNNARDKVMEERMKSMTEKINELSVRVDKDNQFNDRLIVVEQAIDAFHRRLDHIDKGE
jgi:hypothetical protein